MDPDKERHKFISPFASGARNKFRGSPIINDLKKEIDHKAAVQEGMLSTIQSVVLNLEKKFNTMEKEVGNIRRDMETIANRAQDQSCRCNCPLVTDELMATFSSTFTRHFRQLKTDMGNSQFLEFGAEGGDVPQQSKSDSSQSEFEEMVKKEIHTAVSEIVKSVDERLTSLKSFVATSIQEQAISNRLTIQETMCEKIEDMKTLLHSRGLEENSSSVDSVDTIGTDIDLSLLIKNMSQVLVEIKNEARLMQEFRESVAEVLESRVCGEEACRNDGFVLKALGVRDDELMDRLSSLSEKIEQLPNINSVLREMIRHFSQIKELTDPDRLNTVAETCSIGRTSYKTKQDFCTVQAYGRYVIETLRPGMRVRYLLSNDWSIPLGDTGIVDEVDVGFVTVNWCKAGRIGAPCEEVEIME